MSIGIGDGAGSYFDLHTGQKGLGKKVSKETIQVYLSRYGVDKERIDELLRCSSEKSIDSICSERESKVKDCEHIELICKSVLNMESLVSKEILGNCVACSKDTKNSCGKCDSSFCGSECQKKMWRQHKVFCDALPYPTLPLAEKTVYAFLLPQNGQMVILIQVSIELVFDEYRQVYLDKPKLEPFLGDYNGRSFMPRNLYNKKRIMNDMLIFNYNDNFFNDGFKINEVVQEITNGLCPYDWRGPIVVIKAEGQITNEPFKNYLDISLKDFPNIIDFFANMYGDSQEEDDEDEEDE